MRINPYPWLANPRFPPAFRRWLYRLFGLGLLVAGFALFGDVLLLAAGHGLHVLVEVVEATLERVLEKVFGLTPRHAQFVLAYTALLVGVYGLVIGVRKAYAAGIRAWLAAKALGLRLVASAQAVWRQPRRPEIIIAVGVVAATVYLFT